MLAPGFFGTGLIFENFHNLLYDCRRDWNSLAKTPFSWGAKSLKRQALKQSGPVVLFGFNSKRLAATSSSLITIVVSTGRFLHISSHSALPSMVSNLLKKWDRSLTKFWLQNNYPFYWTYPLVCLVPPMPVSHYQLKICSLFYSKGRQPSFHWYSFSAVLIPRTCYLGKSSRFWFQTQCLHRTLYCIWCNGVCKFIGILAGLEEKVPISLLEAVPELLFTSVWPHLYLLGDRFHSFHYSLVFG